MFIAIRSGSGLACSFAAPQVLPKLCVATGASNLGQPDDRLGSLDLAEEGRRPSKLSLRQCASRWARASATPQSRLRSSFKPTSSVARWSGRGIRSTDQHTSLPQQPDYLTARIGGEHSSSTLPLQLNSTRRRGLLATRACMREPNRHARDKETCDRRLYDTPEFCQGHEVGDQVQWIGRLLTGNQVPIS